MVSAYERGERALSVVRFLRLASVYGIPAMDLLTPGAVDAAPAADTEAVAGDTAIDLTAPPDDDVERDDLARFVLALREMRTSQGETTALRVRQADVVVLAAAFGESEAAVEEHLASLAEPAGATTGHERAAPMVTGVASGRRRARRATTSFGTRTHP